MTDAPLRIACIGASLTFGLGLPNRREQCYPAVLQRLLGPGYHVRNLGYAGACAMRGGHESYWETVTFQSATRFAPQVSIVCLGTNDAQHQNVPKLSAFEQDLADIAAHFASLSAGGRVLLAATPPVFPPLPEIDLEALNGRVRPGVERVARRLGLRLVDFYSPLADRPELFPDRLHPDAAGAEVLALAARDALVGDALAG